jgi:murein DD-endopeptidase MepM/ murein hydrolase activator NlpD
MLYKIYKLILAGSLFLLISCDNMVKEKPLPLSSAADTADKKAIVPAVLMYGIPSDSFDLVTGHIKKNDFLSEILIKYGVNMKDINQITENSGKVFDVRSIRSGNKYIVFCERDSQATARFLVYEEGPSKSYIFSLKDSLNITPFMKEIKSEIKYTSGTIESSLWDAMITGGLRPTLAVELSDIFAWTVDFFGLQKGDNFKVIYEEYFIDDQSFGTGKIYGAQFSSAGYSITAIPFIQNGTETYFDVEGKSLKKAFLKAPLKFSRISSRYTSSRMHPILRIRRPHYGVDYAAPIGTPVLAIGDGRVISAGVQGGAGRTVKIQHNSVYSTAYLHLSRFGKGITQGAHVKQGDIVGYVGSSGLSTGPHLDFRFYRNGSPIDPLKVDAPPAEPISDENRENFEKMKTVILSLLETIK